MELVESREVKMKKYWASISPEDRELEMLWYHYQAQRYANSARWSLNVILFIILLTFALSIFGGLILSSLAI